MTTKLNNQFFFVAPLEVVKVTKDNLQEAAEWCGGKVATVESRKVPGRMDSYVWVPTPKGTQISWAFPGMFITRRIVITLRNEITYTFQVYRRDYFEKNYFNEVADAVDKTWERAAKARHPKTMQQISGQHTKPAPDIQRMMGKHGSTDIAGVPDDSQSLGEAVALVERELGGVLILEHNHTSEEKCDDHNCKTDRYVDGEHRFTDKTVTTVPADAPPVEGGTASEIPVEDLHADLGKPDHADGTGTVTNHVSAAVAANEAAAEEGP